MTSGAGSPGPAGGGAAVVTLVGVSFFGVVFFGPVGGFAVVFGGPLVVSDFLPGGGVGEGLGFVVGFGLGVVFAGGFVGGLGVVLGGAGGESVPPGLGPGLDGEVGGPLFDGTSISGVSQAKTKQINSLSAPDSTEL